MNDDATSQLPKAWHRYGINFHNGIYHQNDRNSLMSNIINYFQSVPIPVELQSFSVE